MRNVRYGFTMIELLFVIVIMGITGGIALETIRQYYDGIYRTKIYTQRVSEADHILDQLTKYFENAIELSIVNMDKDAADGALVGTCVGDPVPEAAGVASDYTTVFVGVDVDSLKVAGTPGWSETAKDPFDGTSITSNEANLSAAQALIPLFYPGSTLSNSAIYNHQGALFDTCTDFYTNNGDAYFTITGTLTGNTLPLQDNFAAYTAPIEKDKKYLLRTGYAFRVLTTGDFMMYTNFRPWKGEVYSSGTQSLLGADVASFYLDFDNSRNYNERGSILRLKVCMRGLDSDLSDSDVAGQAICRERKVHVRY